MKIESVRIENFRCFKDETIKFDDYTCMVGPNGAGKSTVFSALNVFFRQYKDSKTDLSKLSADDFHHKDTSVPITITVTFSDLSDKAKEDLSDYVRQDKLVVSAIAKYDSSSETAEVKQYGKRLGLEKFRKFFESEKQKATVADLKLIYKGFQKEYNKLPNATSKGDMIDALHQYEVNNPDDCTLIPSEDQFYGISKGTNRLAPHIQWIFVAASKDATEESDESKTSALGQLLSRTVRSKINFTEMIKKLKEQAQSDYQTILDAEQSALDGISTSLQERLKSWAHPNISAQVLWKQDSEKSVKVEEPWAFIKIGERGFEGDLSRFGLGLQRSYMLALLQELTQVGDVSAPTLIMGIEEPEVYQHPPQARYLAETLHDLSESNSQIMICSHSPLFVPGDNFERIRVVRESGKPSLSYVSQLDYSELATNLEKAGQKLLKESGMLAKLYPSLDPIVSEMFFCNILILVEGIEDVAQITTHLMLTNKINEFRRYGCHIVPVGGKNKIIKPLAMANLLNIPVFVVCDADTNKEEESEVTMHKADNKYILSLSNNSSENEWPSATIWKNNLVMWKVSGSDTIKNEIGDKWSEYETQSALYYGNPGGLKKNPLAIARALELAWNDNFKSDSLVKLIDMIISFAEEKSTS